MLSIIDVTADSIWLQARREFMSFHGGKIVPGRKSETKEIRPVILTLPNPRNRWVVSRTPVINPAAVLSEVVWILAGRDDSAFVNFWNSKLPEFAGKGDTYYGAYGFRMRQGFGVDQLHNAAEALISNPHSRQVCISIWDPRLDLPLINGNPRAEDIPCNVMSLLKVRNGRLEWTQIMRSNDMWLGLPFNIVQFTMLQEIMASWIGVKVGYYYHFTDSLHIYPDMEGKLSELEPVIGIPANTDDFTITDRAESLVTLKSMTERLENLIVITDNKYLYRIALPLEGWAESYANMYRVISAEACRRKGDVGIANDVMSECSNPLFELLWSRWIERLG